MTQSAMNNAVVLYELSITRDCVEAAEQIYTCVPMLKEVFIDPTVSPDRKNNIITKIFHQDEFPTAMIHFMEYMCSHGQMDELEDVFEAFYTYWDKKNNILRAEIIYSKELPEEEVPRLEKFLEHKYPGQKVIFQMTKDQDILGGTVLRVGHEEYDASYEGRLRQLERKLIGR